MKARVYIFIGILVLLIGGVVVFQSRINRDTSSTISDTESSQQRLVTTPNAAQPTRKPKENEVVVDINFGNSLPVHEYVVAQNAYEALIAAAKKKNYPVETKEFPYGKMIVKVGNQASNTAYYWNYKVNGKNGTVAADRYIIHPGDTVEWQYISVK